MKCFSQLTLVTLLGCILVVPAVAAERRTTTSRSTESARSRTTTGTRKPNTTLGNPSAKQVANTRRTKFSSTQPTGRRVDATKLMERPSNPKTYGPPAKFVPGPTKNQPLQRPNFSAKQPSPTKVQPELSKFRGQPSQMTIGRPEEGLTRKSRPQVGGRVKATNVIDDSQKFAQDVVEVIKRNPGTGEPQGPSPSEILADKIDRAGRAAEQAIDDPVGSANRVGRAGREFVENQVDIAQEQGRQVVSELERQAEAGRRQVEETVRGVSETAKDYYDSAVDAGNWAGREVQAGLEQVARETQPVIDATAGAVERVGGAVGRKVDAAREAGEQAADAAQQAAQQAADAAQQAAEQAAQAAQEAAQAAQDAAQQAAAEAAQAAQQAAQQAAEAAEQAKEDAKSGAQDAVQDTADAINNFIDGLF